MPSLLWAYSRRYTVAFIPGGAAVVGSIAIVMLLMLRARQQAERTKVTNVQGKLYNVLCTTVKPPNTAPEPYTPPPPPLYRRSSPKQASYRSNVTSQNRHFLPYTDNVRLSATPISPQNNLWSRPPLTSCNHLGTNMQSLHILSDNRITYQNLIYAGTSTEL